MGKGFRDLKVWQRSMRLVTDIYQATADFPSEEKYGLTSQLRRAAVSIPANIAEGSGRETTRDNLRFLSIAQGSIAEVETLLEISIDLGLLTNDTIESTFIELQEIARMLRGLRRTLSAKMGTKHNE